MRSLVTGGAGFIGSHVVDALIARGDKVLVLDDMSGGFPENVNPKATLIVDSITNPMDEYFAQFKPDYLYHCAAYAAEGLSHFIRRFNYTNNLIGSVNLINASIKHGVKCFVFTSSIAVYGNSPTPMLETHTEKPEDPYGIAKLAVEMDLYAAHKMFGLPFIVFRPHNVYGERQNIADPYRNVVGLFMDAVLNGNPCRIFGDGSQVRQFSYISDVAPIIAESVKNPDALNRTFNVGLGEKVTVLGLAKKVQAVLGKNTGEVYMPSRKEVHTVYADHTRSRITFGCTNYVSLDEGLARMADWVKSKGPHTRTPSPTLELTKGLPEAWKNL